MFPILSY